MLYKTARLCVEQKKIRNLDALTVNVSTVEMTEPNVFEDRNSEELFLLLVEFFKKRGFSLVAEGIETEAQRDYVESAGFDFIQGYLYSKPLPADESLRFFESR